MKRNQKYPRKEARWKIEERNRRRRNFRDFWIYFIVFAFFFGILGYFGNIMKTAIIAVYYGVLGGGNTITTINYCSLKQCLMNADWLQLCLKSVFVAVIVTFLNNRNYRINQFYGVIGWFGYLLKFLLVAAWTGITTFKWKITIKNILMDYDFDFISKICQTMAVYLILKFLNGDVKRN